LHYTKNLIHISNYLFMSIFIEKLKQEHRVILDALENVQNQDISLSEKLIILMEVKSALIEHLKKEDEKLYPFLNKEAKKDANLFSDIAKYANEMNKISDFIFNFYEKYTKLEDISHYFFKSDLNLFITTLKDRILKEEIYLYKEFLERKKE